MSFGTQPPASEFDPTVLDDESLGAEVGGGEPRPAPVKASDRLFSVDALRGFALLGILAMNIVGFGWPGAAYSDPTRAGGGTVDLAVWFVNHLLFDGKMMTLFSMLFGAGLVMMNDRAEARGASLRGVYFRRIFWLLVIGAIHGYLIWDGDVLFLYAECGLVLYFFRNLRPRTLIAVGLALTLGLVPVVLGLGAAADALKRVSARVDAQIAAGETPSKLDRRLRDLWIDDLQKEFTPSPEQQTKQWNEEMEVYRGGYLGIVKHRFWDVLIVQTIGFLLGGFLFAGGRMFLGMGLMKLGVFGGERSPRFYAWTAALGYGIGLPLMVVDAVEQFRHGFKDEYFLHGGEFYNAFGSLVVAIGHVGLVVLIIKSGALVGLTRRLAAVGRMALSNYLTHSIVCTTLFYGYGFGLYGQVDRLGLAAIMLAIWIFQLVVSPIWLDRFRFGPAEWLWRSLTYGKLQPMRIETSPATAVVTD
ncbi:MAG: DUF418 domain-containing protein [Paludisphaera borealis]|uniref:DUF418 domain-containing protein n=1 Tax=Paludisphaera borealis TaxID=1387353 RepID=UPI0028403968|nr:DUF418 domain-containing protein [Paludisphaera borealis]MDR3618474.1 DUF418 domain-containing protein [Paludisphaera borealis]